MTIIHASLPAQNLSSLFLQPNISVIILLYKNHVYFAQIIIIFNQKTFKNTLFNLIYNIIIK